ncbi:hypothetical protein [Photobacterium damselae]
MRYILLMLCFFPIISTAYVLDASITGNKIEYKSVGNSNSGSSNKVILAWIPSVNLLPVKSWSPGFKFRNQAIILNGPGNTRVNIGEAISIVGLEYKSNNSLVEVNNASLPGGQCSSSGFSGDVAYVENKSIGTPCRSFNVFNGSNKTPFNFIRPIIRIDENKIIEEFGKLSDRTEGFYTSSIKFDYAYSYEQINGVKTWRNLSNSIMISFYYKPNMITSVSLKDNGIHDMKISENGRDNIRGESIFNVIVEGYFNNGIGLKLSDSNIYQLSSIGKGVGAKSIPFSIECGSCSKSTLVDNGIINESEVVVNATSSGDKIIIPIHVYFNSRKSEIPIGKYYGQFTMLFTADL